MTCVCLCVSVSVCVYLCVSICIFLGLSEALSSVLYLCNSLKGSPGEKIKEFC